ncbi:uncharacterized protein LOC112527765 isoform X1 [Cynara cardunculus var. scolymus]|uniref:uncharacterized protein LOC112527765 isoform X1 n=1 Tax=Cynara cardunculus var. scolymus TaxID=59895 RepID=UPI000D624C40|nr:uncharacterized protein LOC112527765 isoform X1 [Cynara cardunculus var. scolymus]
MKPARLLTTNPSRPILFKPPTLGSNVNWVYGRFRPPGVRFPLACLATSSTHDTHLTASPTKIAEVGSSGVFPDSPYQGKSQRWEENVEKGIYNCRFLTLLAVLGSLIGSFLCFLKGCTYVASSFQDYFLNHGRGILMLVEAIGNLILWEQSYVYLLGTVMLVFGMGLYELFISNLDLAQSTSEKTTTHQSNLFGLFVLKERPKWLEIKSVNALKTKLGHVIVMLLLIGLFEKSKKAAILTATDLVCFSGCVLLSSCSLYLLSKLQ